MEQQKIKYFPRLRELRISAGCNQTEIADLLDMQQNQYSRYERGERELPSTCSFDLPSTTTSALTTWWVSPM